MGTITLTTDFGGHYLGIIKGVIMGIDPSAEIYEITSELPPFDTKSGAFALRSSYSYFRRGTVHLAIVDPGVGSARRAIAVRTRNYFFIGPDNGLLMLAARHDGIEGVRRLTNTRLQRTPVSPTFHGRDVFAPVAAYLASGGRWEEVGEEFEGPMELQVFKERESGGRISCEVIFIDRFGNLTLSIAQEDVDLRGELGIMVSGHEHRGRVVSTYEEGSDGLSLLVGSAGFYEIALKRGSAAGIARARVGDRVVLVPKAASSQKKG